MVFKYIFITEYDNFTYEIDHNFDNVSFTNESTCLYFDKMAPAAPPSTITEQTVASTTDTDLTPSIDALTSTPPKQICLGLHILAPSSS